MFWEVWWALVLGFLLSGIVQAWVPRAPLERALGDRGPRSAAIATGLGAASSSCSYAAVAIAKSLFQKGSSLASAMAFQFASTRSEERRVGKECRSRWSPYPSKKNPTPNPTPHPPPHPHHPPPPPP